MNGKKTILNRFLNRLQQKMVIKICMKGENSRQKALKIAVTQPGVESVALQGPEKDQLVVIGDGIDSIVLMTLLRKSMGYAELVSVEEQKKETKE
ncbi:heavy metal-associated isoprenylated plant protein 47-like [Telopea speciosissima]|uniref:heavy metal-associated isoprenylated plant protein 47-like n=1 Tax=Telopea speciosissima TaxID=54955 RepID=UPI001CC3AC88|nr:heavy metal-associated isoprenylated plant protein 47-like [Telopea speciosissima]